MTAQLNCTHCQRLLTFDDAVPVGVKLRCPGCGKVFVNAGKTAVGKDNLPVAKPFAPPPATELTEGPSRSVSPRLGATLAVLAGILVTGAVVGGVFLIPPAPQARPPEEKKIVQIAKKTESPPEGTQAPSPALAVVPKKEPDVPAKAGSPPEAEKKAVTPAPAPTSVTEKSVTEKKSPSSPLPPELQQKVNEAIRGGVAYLRDPQSSNGAWTAKVHPVGHAALRGLTFLECEVPKDDPLLVRTAEEVRAKAGPCVQTYDVSLAVLFLDRLGDPADVQLIQRLALRLVSVQNAAGGWGYVCPGDGGFTAKDWLAKLQAERAGRLAKKDEKGEKTIPSVPDAPRPMPFPPGAPGPRIHGQNAGGDNSNTQFALLALWAARRHSLPLEQCFADAERRFRQTQLGDGGWTYSPKLTAAAGLSSKSMTCVGLLGLAIGRGSEYELLHLDKSASGESVQKLTAHDERIQQGLKHLGKHIGTPTGRTRGLPMQNTYFLWSVERVAVLYGLSTIGDKDWYRWGTEILLSNQQVDGRWSEQGNNLTDASVDTCFALLFLRRANLAPDLSRNLRLYIPVVDPDRRSGSAP
jgi:hypothetical protein